MTSQAQTGGPNGLESFAGGGGPGQAEVFETRSVDSPTVRDGEPKARSRVNEVVAA
jgi:hypothetical protein